MRPPPPAAWAVGPPRMRPRPPINRAKRTLPTFFASDTEAVWELARHRSVFIEQRPEHAGHAMHTIFVDDLDALVAQIADRGLEPAKRETYSNGVRKAIYSIPTETRSGSAALHFNYFLLKNPWR
jgi:hypothetical protein